MSPEETGVNLSTFACLFLLSLWLQQGLYRVYQGIRLFGLSQQRLVYLTELCNSLLLRRWFHCHSEGALSARPDPEREGQQAPQASQTKNLLQKGFGN